MESFITCKKLVEKFPCSVYAEKTLKQFHQKFWFGSKRIIYDSIVNEAWAKLFPLELPEIIEIVGLKFVVDNAFKAQFMDIFIAGGALKNAYVDQ